MKKRLSQFSLTAFAMLLMFSLMGFAAPAFAAGRTMRQGDSGQDVQNLQTQLKTLGYLSSSPDGKYGSQTTAAVKSFQKDKSLGIDGIAGATTQSKLAEAANNASKPSSSSYITANRVLSSGTTGTDVTQLQTRLVSLNYLAGTPNGKFEAATKQAVMNFQAANGLTADGVVGALTLAKLNSSNPVASTTSGGSTSTSISTNRVLSSGTTGADVSQLQNRLVELHYLTGAASGTFDAATKAAVIAFQNANVLKADGVVGAATRTKLNSQGAVAASTAPTAYVSTNRALKQGSTGSDVTQLQTRLVSLKYLAGTPNGSFDAATKAAVVAFQKANGLTGDGIVGSQTLAKLNSDSAVVSGGTSTTPTAYITATRTLKQGTSGNDVTQLQTRLINLKYLSGTAGGNFDAATKAAVIAFQKANGLTGDGIVGSQTLAKLNSDSAVANSSPSSSTALPAVRSAGTSFYRMNNEATLRKGSTGNDVKDLQTALKLLGYYSGTPDGNFGDGTLTAVKAFQTDLRETADGIAGNYTLSPLYTMVQMPTTQDMATVTPAVYDPGLSYPIEKPNWSDNATVLPKNSTFTVIDVHSGLSFKMKRTGGSNHADCEPLTLLDTITIYKAYGNRWSWDRHPIWVIVNGHRLAASMNGMPHGYHTIANNGMCGQLCVHLVGSRTHGTNVVDPDHQKAIDEAYNATKVPGILS